MPTIVPRRVKLVQSSVPTGQRIYLGVDASYSGLAIAQFDGKEFGSVVGRFPGKEDWGTAQTLLRVIDIEDWLAGVCTAWQGLDIGAITMEGYSRGAKNKREESGELAVTVRKAIYEHLGRIPCLVAPLQLKKFVTGSTKAEKADMKLHVFKRWGFDVGTDPGGNIADAAGLAVIARALCEGETTENGAQREVLTALGRDRSWRLTREQLQQMAMLPSAKRGVLGTIPQVRAAALS